MDAGFRVEADMLAWVAAGAAALAGRPVQVLYELPTATSGVPDVVLVDQVPGALSERQGAGPITDLLSLAVVCSLTRDGTGVFTMSVPELARQAGTTCRHLQQRLLPALREQGHVEAVEVGCWAPRYAWRSTASLVVTVEAKLSDWRRALGQASRHASGADGSWVAVAPAAARRAAPHADAFRDRGVGLASVDPVAGLSPLVVPSGHAVSLRLRRELLAERAADLIQAGRNSGPVPLVFGRALTATGFDPRLAGVLVG